MDEWVGRLSNGMFGLLLVLIFFAVQAGWKWLAKQLTSIKHGEKTSGKIAASLSTPRLTKHASMDFISAKLSRLLTMPSVIVSSVVVVGLFATFQIGRQEQAFFQFGKQVIEFTSLERCHHYVKTRSPDWSEQAVSKVCFLK